ncbi:MAG: hypothetical protein ACE5ET_02335 [Gammaproteobacteria bacterium]
MQRTAGALLLTMALLLLAACSGPAGDDNAWLLGRWEVAYNPAADDEDVLLFREDGSVLVQTVDGREVHGRYQIRRGRLDLELALATRVLQVSFDISPDHSRLVFAKTGAYYQRQQ